MEQRSREEILRKIEETDRIIFDFMLMQLFSYLGMCSAISMRQELQKELEQEGER